MVFVTRSGSALLVSPWKDGLKVKDIIRKRRGIQNVLVLFPPCDNKGQQDDILEDEDLLNLFQILGNNFPMLSNVTISVQNSAVVGQQERHYARGVGVGQSNKRVIPGLKAITALLNGTNNNNSSTNNNHLINLTLVQTKLLGNDQEFADFVSAIRFHPTLQGFDCTGCVFSKPSHFQDLKNALDSRTNNNNNNTMMNHVYIDDCIVLEESVMALTNGDEEGRTATLFSYPSHWLCVDSSGFSDFSDNIECACTNE
eukprot:scaffold5540_cov96-Cylindrotheca_fusiformis.AAC.14